jgi:hypothetical protein
MASGDSEHRMLFDIRGRRRNVVKIVYAVLALLMGTSLFLTVGPFNLGEIFNSGTATGDAAETFEDRAERLEAKLTKTPEDPDLLVALTRARVNAGNAHFEIGSQGERIPTQDAVQQLRLASDSWSDYLKAASEHNAGLAQLMAPTLLSLAEYSPIPEADANIEAAREAQQIVVDQRPNLNSLSTMAFFTALTGDSAAAKGFAAKAEKVASSKPERENISKELKRYERLGRRLDRLVAQTQQQSGGQAGKEALESPAGGPLGGLGAGGGAGLGE